MSRTIGTIFDLKEIFVKATDLIFCGTPAERVAAPVIEETADGKIPDSLSSIEVWKRDPKWEIQPTNFNRRSGGAGKRKPVRLARAAAVIGKNSPVVRFSV